MSLRQLVEGDCGGVNPLMQLGGQFTRDAARKDEGFASAQFERSMRPEEQLVNEFFGQVAGPPQSFQMDTLLQEMREIEVGTASATQLRAAPRVIDEVTGRWAEEFGRAGGDCAQPPPAPQPQQDMFYQHMAQRNVSEFFDESQGPSSLAYAPPMSGYLMQTPYLAICPPFHPPQETSSTDQFFAEVEGDRATLENHLTKQADSTEDWINDYQANNADNEQSGASYNEQFWSRLHEEWQKLSEESEHPWLSEFDDSYDPYKEYNFAEENPMSEIANAFAKGKEYYAQGDIPSAVLCFEVAAKKEPENAEVWEHLGIAQAENEMDPQSIAALKHSLDLQPQNRRVLMALAVCYTNESLQHQAVKMLTNWLHEHPKYTALLQHHPLLLEQGGGAMAGTLIGGNKLQELQMVFLEAARLNPQELDGEIQEALGVLYNLSSEFDKAVDCFRAALQVNPDNAKIWNRLGASLANGSRSVEAVEAYQHALELQPGFIRVRYNVGVCCLNLKAYREAVEHLLIALNMQANSGAMRELPAGIPPPASAQSESTWITLKMVISLMGRNELQGHVNDRNLTALNEAFAVQN